MVVKVHHLCKIRELKQIAKQLGETEIISKEIFTCILGRYVMAKILMEMELQQGTHVIGRDVTANTLMGMAFDILLVDIF